MSKYPADVVVNTCNGPEPCCLKHAIHLEKLMQLMGVFTNQTAAPSDAQCNNCINEMKAEHALPKLNL